MKLLRSLRISAALGCVLLLGLGVALAQSASSPKGLLTFPEASKPYEPGKLVVRFKSGTDASERAATRRSRGASVEQGLQLPRTQLLEIADGQSVKQAEASFDGSADVEFAEPNYIYSVEATPNDSDYSKLWGLNNTGQTVNGKAGTADADIDAPEAWNTTTGSQSITVAVIDTGITYDHPDLAPNIWSNPGETGGGKETNGVDDDSNGYVDDSRGWDWTQGDNDPRDLNGHGTHVAGTIGAKGNNGSGVTGVNWQTKLMALRALDSGGSGTSADLTDALYYAAAKGAKVVNASWGGSGYSQAMQAAIASSPGTLFVVAAGNDAENVDQSSQYPCAYTAVNLVCVAATDQDDALASFSNYGATRVDLAAPGVNVYSTWPGYSSVQTENFNTNITSRWTTGGTNNSWARTSAVKVSGQSLTDSPAGDYLNSTDSFARRIAGADLTGKTGCRTEMAVRLDTEVNAQGTTAFDYLTSEESHDGSTWNKLGTLGGSTNGVFLKAGYDLSHLDGQSSVRTGFKMFANSTIARDGVYIDDVAVKCLAFGTGGYQYLQGTSMATPHAAGVAALVFAKHAAATPAYVKQTLLSSVDAKPSLTGKTVSGGRLNAQKAVTAAAPSGTGSARIALTGNAIDYTAGNGQANNVLVGEIGQSYIFQDTSVGSLADGDGAGGCTVGGNIATCPVAGTKSVGFDLGDGNDVVSSGLSIPTSTQGGSGNDQITNTSEWDMVMVGGAGNDNLSSGPGDDTLLGGADNDVLGGNGGVDILDGGTGSDQIAGGDDFDLVSYGSRIAGHGVRVTLADDGNSDGEAGEFDNVDSSSEDVIGGDGNDTITGNGSPNHLLGGDGNDVIDGGGGGDTVFGESGADTVSGGDGGECPSAYGGDAPGGSGGVSGGSGNDILHGDGGRDCVIGGPGNDQQYGDSGTDAFLASDTSPGSDGADTISGGPDDNDSMAAYAFRSSGVAIALDGAANDGAPGEQDNIGSDVEIVNGSNQADTITGNAGVNTIIGALGDDTLSGGGDQDTISGDVGRDTINGDGGDDFLYGESDDDNVNGGDGNDKVDGGSGYDYGTPTGNDTLAGGTGNDSLVGWNGDDNMFGQDGNDTYAGGDGNDLMHEPGVSNDTMVGDAGADLMFGGGGNDILLGLDGDDAMSGDDGSDIVFDELWGLGSGNDTLIGGNGGDQLLGQSGADTIYARDLAPGGWVFWADTVDCGDNPVGLPDKAQFNTQNYPDVVTGCEQVLP